MGRKLILAAMSIAAVAAFAVPAVANAAVIEFEGGGVVPAETGTEITGTANATSPRLVTETDLGTLECESIMLGGNLTKNDGENVEGSGEPSQSTTSGCSFNKEFEANVTEINLKSITSLAGETGTGHFEASWASEIPGGVECKYATSTPGVFHYVLGGDLLEITPTNVSSAGGCGTSTLKGSVTLEARTSDGTIDHVVLK